jgi:alpha-glucoside transport system substrate-binding protein
MTSATRRHRFRWLAALMALGLLAAACGNDDDDTADTGDDDTATDEGDELPGAGTGGNVTISGPETGAEADGFNAALDAFAEESGINATYSGSRDFETQVRVAAEGGNLPDLAVIPQPGLVADLVDQITPVPQDTLDAHRDEFDP